MLVISIWITQMVLHVADDRILPIGKINRPIRSNVYRHRAEIVVARTDEVFERLAFQARTVLADFDAIDALKPNYITVQEIALKLGWKMAAGQDRRSRAWA